MKNLNWMHWVAIAGSGLIIGLCSLHIIKSQAVEQAAEEVLQHETGIEIQLPPSK